MDWIKDNKFLAGFAAFTLVGSLALGFFLVTGWLKYSETYADYQDLAAANDRLAKKPVYPSSLNVDAEKDRVGSYVEKSRDLLDLLIDRQAPVEDISLDSFPLLLKEAFDNLTAKARQKNFSLPEDFFFGMRTYREGLPQEGAVDELGFQLSAISHLVDLLIESGVSGIDEYINRVPMKSESEEEEEEEEDPRRRQGRGSRDRGGKDKAKSWPVFKDGEIPYAPDEVLDTYRIKLQFTAEHDAMAEFLNRMTNDEKYFYWLRSLRIENESKGGKSTEDDFQPTPVPEEELAPEEPAGFPGLEGGEAAPGGEGEGDPADPAIPIIEAPMIPAVEFDADGNPILGGGEGAMIDTRILFGSEQVRVLAEIDIVRFKDPGGADAKKDSKPKKDAGADDGDSGSR